MVAIGGMRVYMDEPQLTRLLAVTSLLGNKIQEFTKAAEDLTKEIKRYNDTPQPEFQTLFADDQEVGYTVELGGQRFTKDQWEAMLVWRAGTEMETERTT